MSEPRSPAPGPRSGKYRARERRTHWINPAIPIAPPAAAPERRPQKTRERIRRRQEDRRLPLVDWTWAVIGIALVGIIAAVGMITLSTTTAAPPGSASLATVADAAGAPAPAETPAPGGAGVAPVGVEALPTVEIRPWDGQRRVTVLLMGIDQRPGEQGTGFRTDTLILISMDPATNSVGMLSIPRDLRVPIPGHADMQPINAAYVLGELARPGYGPQLAAETVQYNLGMTIDHYVVLSFTAVINLIDAIGGITVDVPSSIVDEEFPDLYTYGYDPLYIPAGRIEMDGLLALKYARTRHQDTDFDRTRRQQQVIMAIRDRVLRPEMLPRLVAQAPVIWNEVSRGIITDFSFEELLSIGWYAKDIPAENIRRGALDGVHILATQYQGRSILTINRNTIADLMVEVFGPDYNR